MNEIVSNAPVTPSTGSFLDDLGACATTYSLITYGITVVGGVSARKGEFPHMVALGRLDSDKFNLMCGATLISHTWVLSAAHCTYGPKYASIISLSYLKILKTEFTFHLPMILLNAKRDGTKISKLKNIPKTNS